ncbi:MAG: TRAP transporter substrate-binding protein [Candidatus Cyclobacteriaceae bacterium M3_2C_046]
MIKVGLTHAQSHSFTQALLRFKNCFEQKTNNRYQIRIFHSSQLGGEKEMQEMLTVGSLEISLSGVVNTYEPMFAIFEMPYLYRDREHIFKVNNSQVMQQISLPLQNNGIRLIGFYENGFRNITNSIRPIHTPDDVAGLKIRTPENPAQIETMKALAAIPTPMSFSELYTALVQGVVDGQENPLQNIWFNRLYEAQPYLAMTHHIYNSLYILAGKRFWQSLPANDQVLLKECLAASSLWQLNYMETLDKELEQKMKEYGIEFTYPDRAAFEKASWPAYESIYQQLGEEARNYVQQIKQIE